MANTLITPSIIARMVLDNLYEQAQISQLVHRDFDADFSGKQGDTITVRKPATFTADEYDRATGIVLQDITEGSFTVSLDTLLDVSFPITTEELTLEVDEWENRFAVPAAEAILAAIETKILTALLTTTNTVGVDATPPTDPTILVDAGKVLNDNKVPKTQRYAALTTTVEANFTKDPLFHQADQRGDTDGIREAMIGRKFGFDVMSTTHMPAGGDSVAFHRSAGAVVFRTPTKPLGVADEQFSVMSYKGFGLRVVRDYDVDKKQDVISIDCLMGAKLLDEDRAVKILG